MINQIISREGYEKLKQELQILTKTKRHQIAERIQSAKDLGDLSENAEYSDAKDAQAFNEGRIAEIEALLKTVNIVENAGAREVGMGSTVTVKTDGKTKTYTIVSFNEVEPQAGKISNESPLGKAFLHKKKGETVTVTTPIKVIEYEIIDIK